MTAETPRLSPPSLASVERAGPWAVLLLTALLSTACEPGLETSASEGTLPRDPANVILISVDTLRADHLGLYGYERDTSPHLDSLAAESVVFDQFIMNGGFTLPSHMSMMTGLLPTVHGIRAHTDEALPEARITLAEQLQEAGYATAGFVDGGYVRGFYGFTQGFDVYDDDGGRFQTILPKAYDWLRTQAESKEPFFLFLHTYDVHAHPDRPPFPDRRPYNCPDPFPHRFVEKPPPTYDGCRDGECASKVLVQVNKWFEQGKVIPAEYFTPEEMEYIVGLYDGCINYVDQQIADLMDLLQNLGVYDRTLVVVTSDHGEEFLDHDMLLHRQRGYDELAHIPLLMKLPGSRLGGRRVPYLSAMIDLMPTVLDIVGVEPNPEIQGVSLIPSVTEGRRIHRDTTIWQILRTERWKFFPRREKLFDLQNDPDEIVNLYERSPELVARFQAEVERRKVRDREYAEALDQVAAAPDREIELDEEQLEELKALGYVD